jgi:DNA-binding IclR family transcriptional regulator
VRRVAHMPHRLIAEWRLVQQLLRANAVTPANAQRLDLGRSTERRRLKQLLALGVIREAGSQRFYLDAPVLAARMASQRQNAALALLVLILLFVALFLWAPLRSL